ncbi:MAG: hypothetical protein ACOYOQ_16520 [Microthrixaceae bacterium]
MTGRRGASARKVHTELGRSLRALGSAPGGDELAYLAATSKAEGPVRDRLAWELHRRLGDGYRVAREWRRADLAVLTAGGDLVAQVELKVLASFTALSDPERERYLKYLEIDAAKMCELDEPDCEPSARYLLSVLYDVRGQVPGDPAGIVKYAGRFNGCSQNGTDPGVRAAARRTWRKALEGRFDGTTDTPVEVGAGHVWGVDVSVDCFLTGPLKPVDGNY